MQIVHERCCGVDVHKNKIVACVFAGRRKELREFGTMTDDILAMWEWLEGYECRTVAMESTGVYWKPIYNILEEKAFEILVVNAQHIKAVPGRKTDIRDAEWIADLARHGLVKSSYIPSREQRELREMTRYRQSLVEERARELNRIQAILEGANIKLASVVSDISGQSSMAILRAMMEGNTDPQALSGLAKGSLREKTEQLQRALKGSMGEHQRRMLYFTVRHVDELGNLIGQLDEDIKKKLNPIQQQIELIDAIPGIGVRSAEKILAETGVDMKQFYNVNHFCSWAGLVPQMNESAGKRKNTSLRKGNSYLKSTIVECAVSALRSTDSFLYVRYKKIAPRRGHKRAVVAVAHTMLRAIYFMLKNNQPFHDLGAEYYFTLDADRIKNRNIKTLEKLGYRVTLSPTAT